MLDSIIQEYILYIRNKMEPSRMASRSKTSVPGAVGHNGGPSLDDKPHVSEWGRGAFGTYFAWRAAHRAAWRSIPRETMLRRLEKAETLGLTYEEYQLEIFERGRFLQAEDGEAIAAIKARRKPRRRASQP
jgi:hypothetical protein